ncbi:hypothetical protein F4703DRAFT_1855931 [Phycomyces blakesleeanus]
MMCQALFTLMVLIFTHPSTTYIHLHLNNYIKTSWAALAKKPILAPVPPTRDASARAPASVLTVRNPRLTRKDVPAKAPKKVATVELLASAKSMSSPFR